ncbi:MAG: 16S rRNA (guanine(966)-N(2))-methyltransferase RsmD [Acidobacteriota bacterium]
MRVIAGRYRSRRLRAPSWAGLRPTSDRVKETLFNVVAGRIGGAVVLDGFAGSGALGIEALSRGATEVVFVDSDKRAVDLIARNLAAIGIESGYVMMRSGLVEALGCLPDRQRFELALLDPPYEHADLESILSIVAGRMVPEGVIVLEHARRREVPARAGRAERVRQIVVGDSTLSLYRMAPAAARAMEET